MADNGKSWSNWLLAALFAIVMGMSSVLYAAVVGRISTLEADLKQEKAEKSALMTDIALLKQSSARIEASQVEMDKKLSFVVGSMGTNSALYKDMVRQYKEFIESRRGTK